MNSQLPLFAVASRPASARRDSVHECRNGPHAQPIGATIGRGRENDRARRRQHGDRAAARQRPADRPRAAQAVARSKTRPGSRLGLWAGWEMYAEWGGAPAAGVVTGIGTVAGRRHMVIANDATVKAGAFFPDDHQEGAARPADRHGESPAAGLPGRFGRRLSAAAGRGLSRRGRFRPHLSQQRRHLGGRACRRSRPSWATASPAAAICRCCATSC